MNMIEINFPEIENRGGLRLGKEARLQIFDLIKATDGKNTYVLDNVTVYGRLIKGEVK